ncbi:MAG: hypothetical protein J6A47_03195 [Bacilli bacterium]|nr:hypothetical protein [Bacilli bacterium]
MIEDEVLGQELVDDLDYYFRRNRRNIDCRYRLSLYAYPDEKYVRIVFRLNEYPQGWKFEITENFEYLAKQFLSNRVPGWSVNIEIIG